jgi:hypothetical protein
VNFSRLRLGIGVAVLLSVASAAVGLAQTSPGPLPPPPTPSAATSTAPTTPAPTLTTAPAPAATVPAAGPTLAPEATSSPSRPRRGRRAPGPAATSSASAEPSDTPEPPQFTTLDGIWEVEMQPLGKRLALYSHISIATTGATISGYWEHDPHRTRSPMTGTFDGRLISMTIDMPDGSKPSFNGYVENFGDMVGIFHATDTDAGTAFTAQHRKKIKS